VGGFLSAGKLSTVSIFGHRRVYHSVLPKRAYKIVVDGIESHPFHLEIRRSGDPEIEDDWFLIHQATNPKHSNLTSFSRKGERGQGAGERGKGTGDRGQGKCSD
jgi:hypothetical protein